MIFYEVWWQEQEMDNGNRLKKAQQTRGGTKLQFFAKQNSTPVVFGEQIMFHGKRIAAIQNQMMFGSPFGSRISRMSSSFFFNSLRSQRRSFKACKRQSMKSSVERGMDCPCSPNTILSYVFFKIVHLLRGLQQSRSECHIAWWDLPEA